MILRIAISVWNRAAGPENLGSAKPSLQDRKMRTRPVPTGIALQNVDTAFEAGQAFNVTIIGRALKSWIFTFEVIDPGSGKPQEFTLMTQRGKIREWSDPRNLLQWLDERYGVSEGSFVLLAEEQDHEKGDG